MCTATLHNSEMLFWNNFLMCLANHRKSIILKYYYQECIIIIIHSCYYPQMIAQRVEKDIHLFNARCAVNFITCVHKLFSVAHVTCIRRVYYTSPYIMLKAKLKM